MIDLDKLIDSAATDVRRSIRSDIAPTPSTIARRAGRRAVLIVAVSFLAVGLGGVAVLASLGSGDPVATESSDGLITSEMILEDGVVTEAEYHAGAEGVVACLVAAGFDAEVDFDDPSGHASFSTNGGPADNDAFFSCDEKHLSYNVSLGWSAALGQIDLAKERERIVATFACVEAETGLDFGEVVYDEFDFRTEQGQQSYEAAFEYQDHEPWSMCNNELGYEAEVQAETEALLECVESRTGEDFGELSYDPETGHLTEEASQAIKAAFHYDGDESWEACQKELGFWPYSGSNQPGG